MKDIRLKIKSDNDIEFITDGSFTFAGDTAYLNYKESEISGLDGCMTSLIIRDERVLLKRSGEDLQTLSDDMEFEPGLRFEGLYWTPFGEIPMEILTNNVENNITSDGGQVKIDYRLSLKGLAETTNSIYIEVLDSNYQGHTQMEER